MRNAVLALVLGLAVAGCGGAPGRPDGAPAKQDAPATTVPEAEVISEERCTPGEERALGSRRVAYAASAKGRTPAFARPGGRRLRVFERLNVNGVPTVFGVLAVVLDESCRPAWYRVQLPIRPNGSTGFVRADVVVLHRVRTRIEVDLSDRRIDFFRDGRRVLRVTAAIGSPATPTPTGRYYVNQRLLAADPTGPFGPGGIGISAFSPVLTGWVQGGPIAIHGTNDPSSIGKAVSKGCLRIRNETLRRLFAVTPAGTPIVIRA